MIKRTLWVPPTLALVLLAACDEGLQPVPFQGMSGGVSIVGALPDSTEWVRVAAYLEVPETELDLLGFAGISEPVILAVDSARYVLALDAGDFEWVPVVWKQAGVPLPDGLRVLGWYSEGGAFDTPGAVTVVTDAETGDIDLIADFENALTVAEALELLR